jgi:hypothetical protein
MLRLVGGMEMLLLMLVGEGLSSAKSPLLPTCLLFAKMLTSMSETEIPRALGLTAPTSKSSMISCSLARTFWTFSICRSYIGLLLITKKATALSTTATNTARPNMHPPSRPQRERCRTE